MLLAALAVALLSLSIHLVMPLYALMVVRLLAAELAASLLVLEIVLAGIALLALHGSGRTAVLVTAAAGILLAGASLARVPATIAASDRALDAIGAPAAADGGFSLLRLVAVPLSGGRVPEIRRTNDIPFRTVGETTLRLDRYDPPSAGRHPSIVVLHGGSWSGGDKGAGGIDPTITNRIFAARGYTVYDLQYRLVHSDRARRDPPVPRAGRPRGLTPPPCALRRTCTETAHRPRPSTPGIAPDIPH